MFVLFHFMLLTNRFLFSNVEAMKRTLPRAAETVLSETGWVMTFMAAGPDPLRGGQLHVITYVQSFFL